jgi:hypothetical protein
VTCSSRVTRLSWTNGIVGTAATEAYGLGNTMKSDTSALKLEALLKAARRATWDALHGPSDLRSGRFRPERAAGHAPSGEVAAQPVVAADDRLSSLRSVVRSPLNARTLGRQGRS